MSTRKAAEAREPRPSNGPVGEAFHSATRKWNLRDPKLYVDRELSWLSFNERVLEEAEDESNPLLERVRFIGITQSNMDEFFMVRVSGIMEQVLAGVREPNFAGFTPQEQFERCYTLAREQVDRMYRCWNQMLMPALGTEGIHIRRVSELTEEQREYARDYFDREVFPVLTPLAIDSGHPFPHLRNLSLNLAVRLSPPDGRSLPLNALVQVPNVLVRLIRLPSPKKHYEFLLLEDLIANELELLFPGLQILESRAFRVTRDTDLEIAEEEAEDLLTTIEQSLRIRERGNAVRLGVDGRASEELVEFLQSNLELMPFQVFRLDGAINLTDLAGIVNVVDREELKFRPYIPTVREPLRNERAIFTAISRQDVLVHHPFEAFTSVEQFVLQAARDPKVLAIKQTLYRTSGDSSIVRALIEAAQNGKQVAALMELKARFDEERNIVWARQLEKAGVHVVYGLVGLKTHAKICLVVRKEEDGLRRYVHLGTGNYNPATARIYTDLALFTCDPDLCDDASELFNLLTGYSRMPEWRKMIMAPLQMREAFYSLIHQERGKAREGGRGRIRAKMNSLADPDMIAELYAASRDGVQIDLLVRGICCLRPGIPGVSENIRVHSIVDRYLEHSRIYIFGEDEDDPRVYLASADWMPRNLDRRVEIAFPIEAPALRQRILTEIWATYMRDNVRRRILQPGGHYIRVPRRPDEPPVRAQFELMAIEERHRDRRDDVAPEKAIRTTGSSELVPKMPLRPAKPSGRRVPVSAKILFEGVPKDPPPLGDTARRGTNGRTAKKSKKARETP